MNITIKAFFIIALILLVGNITGCSTRYNAPVGVSGNGPVYQTDGRTHRVNAGETLYAIAWIYDLDYLQLANLNGLSEPYAIFTGELLSIDMRAMPVSRIPKSIPPPVVNVSQTKPVAASQVKVTSQSVGAGRNTVAVNSSQTTKTVSNVAKPAASINVPKNTSSRKPSVVKNPGSTSNNLSWVWPVRGKIISKFNSNSNNKGIDIAGPEGIDILAAEAGEVVYAGGGLLHYGDLIIIKHNNKFLSAYAHNSKLNVKEGEIVSKGQKVAELGSTGVDQNMLHFEIRLTGKPVDPLKYLPANNI